MSDIILEGRALTRVYPGGLVANDQVSIRFAAGRVHSIVGENGAGKSTFVKMLFGAEIPDSGTIYRHGNPTAFAGPSDAIEAGIGMVFQHFSLVPTFRAYENVVMGSEPRSGLSIDRPKAIATVRDLSERFGLKVDPEAPVRDLPVGQQQRVEILKALHRKAQVLILDEPTAVLAPQEVEELFDAVRGLTAEGRTVIFIAHKLPEVLEISDHIAVMRSGRLVAEFDRADATEDRLSRAMVGRDVTLSISASRNVGDKRLGVRNLTVRSARDHLLCDDVTLEARSGEIVGLVGVEGNGQAEVLEAIAGLRPVAGGNITLNGTDLVGRSVLERRELGISHIPPDRLAEGLAEGASIRENIAASWLNDSRFVRKGILDLRAQTTFAEKLKDRFSIKADSVRALVGSLSGGNMQKVVVARELAETPDLLLVNQPTRGVDLGAVEFIWKTLADTRDDGAAILLCSADLSELMALADRFIVFYGGRVVARMDNTPDVTQETLGAYMLGAKSQIEVSHE
ncbi:MAG: ABC transporter ATP-binding protein [Pseudomonadota bacterium]